MGGSEGKANEYAVQVEDKIFTLKRDLSNDYRNSISAIANEFQKPGVQEADISKICRSNMHEIEMILSMIEHHQLFSL